MTTNYDLQTVEGGVPIKMWTRGVPVDDKARAQLASAARMPFVFKHLAVMPDVHVGIGATIGSVIATKGAVIPAAVGVDIGCGMMAARTSLTASDLPDNLEGVRAAIERAVPVRDHGGIRLPRSSRRGRHLPGVSGRSSPNIRSSARPTIWSTLARSAPATTSSRSAWIPNSGFG
jgi:tRNA-splicing ligase RtcB